MTSQIKAIFLCLAFGILNGCASMNQSECLSADWYTVGFGDGVAGQSQGKISNYRKDCAEYAVQPDLERYRQGHLAGSKLFCTEQNGFKQGAQGATYNNNCPQQFEPRFLAAYADGKLLHIASQEVRRIGTKLNSAQKQLDQKLNLIELRQQELIADGLVKAQRAKILEELKLLQQQSSELEQEYFWLNEQLEQAKFELQQLEKNLHQSYQ